MTDEEKKRLDELLSDMSNLVDEVMSTNPFNKMGNQILFFITFMQIFLLFCRRVIDVDLIDCIFFPTFVLQRSIFLVYLFIYFLFDYLFTYLVCYLFIFLFIYDYIYLYALYLHIFYLLIYLLIYL